jgi:hypothetical protein
MAPLADTERRARLVTNEPTLELTGLFTRVTDAEVFTDLKRSSSLSFGDPNERAHPLVNVRIPVLVRCLIASLPCNASPTSPDSSVLPPRSATAWAAPPIRRHRVFHHRFVAAPR